MLEKMEEFFDARLVGYEEHQFTCIESAEAFYPFTAECLPVQDDCNILDLGCGTGLELTYYFKPVSNAHITGIDLGKFSPITYGPVHHTYRKLGDAVGKAFCDGLKLK